MKTIVTQSEKDAIMGRPDWPEFERKMKSYFGQDWELVTLDEAVQKGEGNMKSKMPVLLERLFSIGKEE